MFRKNTNYQARNIFILVTLIFFVVLACNSATSILPTPVPTDTPTPIDTPTPSVTPTPSITPTPRPTFTLTPLPDTNIVLSKAEELCNMAFATSKVTITKQPYRDHFALVMINSELRSGKWERLIVNPVFETVLAEEIGMLICIKEFASYAGKYEDGSKGYRVEWTVRQVSWPDGKIIRQAGDYNDPPKTKFSEGDRYGEPPVEKFFGEGGYFGYNFGGTILPDGSRVALVSFSPNGQTLVVGDANDAITIIDLVTGQTLPALRVYKEDGDAIEKLAFVLDGNLLVSIDRFHSLKMLDPITLQEIYSQDGIITFASAPNGKTIALSYGDKVVILDVITKEIVKEIPDGSAVVSSLVFSANGNFLALGRNLSTDISIIDLVSGEEKTSINVPKGAEDLSFSSDGKLLAATLSDTMGNDQVTIWNIETGKEVYSFEKQGNHSGIITFSPAKNIIAKANEDFSVTIWDVLSSKSLYTLLGHISKINSLAFSPDGNILATGSDDGRVILWDISIGEEIRTFYITAP